MIPTELTINNERWKVILRPLKFDYGQCLHDKRRIVIDSQLPEHEQLETLLHEVMHACLCELWPSTAEEAMIRRLSPRLLDALQSAGLVKR